MSARPGWHKSRRLIVVCCALAVAAGLYLPVPARAQTSLKETTSLAFIPDDVSFYSSSLRLKEQLDAFLASKAWAALKEIESIKMGLGAAAAFTTDGPGAQFLEAPEYEDLRKLLADMFSNEVFCAGDASYADMLVLFGKINSFSRLGTISALGQGGGANASTAQTRMMLRALNENREKLQIPGTLIGFRLTDAERGKQQLTNLEGLVSALLSNNAEMAERFKSKEIDGANFLTLTLDGSMIPWDDVHIEQFEENPGEFSDLIAKAKELTLTVSLGVRDNFLLLGFGKDTGIVTKSNGTKLYDRKELAALHKHEDKRIVTIGYISAEFAKKAGQLEEQIDDFAKMAQMLLPNVPFEEDVRKEMGEDIDKLRDDIVRYLPKPGAAMGFSFIGERGYEGYSYDWSENPMIDGSKKLTLLDHVAGNPILFFATRYKHNPEQFNVFVQYLKRVYYYADKYASQNVPGEQGEKYKGYRDAVLPHLAKLEQITKEKLVPAFKDGQGAFVIDAKAKSKQWFFLMPESEEPLPMLEIAAVYGVSDAELLRTAMSEYFTVAQELIDAVHKVSPEEVPPIKIPEVVTEKTDEGTISSFAFQLPIDPQIKPNAGLSDDVAVVSLTPELTKRVLAKTALSAEEGPLAEHDRELASAASFNFPALVDAVVPWIDYAVELNMDKGDDNDGKGDDDKKDDAKSGDDTEAKPGSKSEEKDDEDEADSKSDDKDGEAESKSDDDDDKGKSENDDDDDEVEKILEQVHEGARILKCIKGYQSVSYLEDGVRVTHHECPIEDLEE